MLQIKTIFVVLLKKSFVIHLCCLKKYSAREINNFPKRYNIYIYIYIYIERERERETVDLVNLARFEKNTGKLDETKHRQQIQ